MTHRLYFRSYKLSAAQYGEILIATAVDGEKMGDTQRCYDVRADAKGFKHLLGRTEVDATSPLWRLEGEVRIQVWSKLTHTPGGTASVIHCKKSDFELMTHLAVVLIHPGGKDNAPLQGTIVDAWLMTSDAAAELRKKKGATDYIRVSQLRTPPLPEGVVSIRTVLAAAADTPLNPTAVFGTSGGQRDVIRKTPGVSGGSACVRDTRIPVWTLWRLKELGRTDAQLLDDYPALSKDDLAAAWAYADANREELAEAVRRQGGSPGRKKPVTV